jgi:single-stranded DNA-binding protein
MAYIDNLDENELRITGVMVGESKTFPHRDNLLTLSISARSYGKTFYEDKRESRRERLMIELHDNAAEKAEYYRAGDILHIKGQLATRRWEDSHNVQHIRTVIVVDDPRKINKISEHRPQASGTVAEQDQDQDRSESDQV